eukprot:scaffold4529_cov151-Skeletonema_marinoi.AAC.2
MRTKFGWHFGSTITLKLPAFVIDTYSLLYTNAATIIVRSLRRDTSRCCNHRTKASDRLFIKACVKSAHSDIVPDAILPTHWILLSLDAQRQNESTQ